VRAAASIGSPLDLVAGGHAIGRGFNMLYTRMFLATLKSKARDKSARFGYAIDAEVLRRARNLYDFDNLFTAPVHGFRDTIDYWTRASAKPLLGNVRVPHLVLNARNDPFVPAASLPTDRDVSNDVVLEQPAEGGHIGFANGPFPGRLRFLPQRLDDFFRTGL
jgi:predicted alpha/beta-fold hydrolase